MQSELEMLEVLRTLQTPFDAVYELSPDGAHYVKPASLRDTPVAKITQDSPYWIPSWESLDDYLAKEGGEDAKKQEWRIRLQRNPGDKKAREAVKKHQDNMSKHYKIREIFGPDSDYHPNQVVSKRHLPTRGLCRKEVMYRLACKISELRELHARGVLAMEPWDFIRWRIGKKIQEKLSLPGKSASSFMASAVYRLCDENQDGSNPHGDAVLRAAVMLAARSQNRLGNYKTHQQPQSSVPDNLTRALARAPGAGRRAPQPARPRRGLPPDAAHAAEEARRAKRARVAAQPSTYQGVNAFRAQMQARMTENESGD